MVAAPEEEIDRLFDAVVGAVTLRAGDLARQGDFYAAAIGLELRDEGRACSVLSSAAAGELIVLDSSSARSGEAPSDPHTGLFHNAFRFPDRPSLAAALKRTAGLAPVFEGASDHGVSEAVYFRDPEGNGIELYRDRPYAEWPVTDDGKVAMFTRPLDLGALAGEADSAAAVDCDLGHIHLRTAEVERAARFWRDVVGLEERQRFGPQAVFLAEGLYHHHIGANTWQSANAPPAPPDRPGLDGFELRLRAPDRVDAAAARLEAAGVDVAADLDGVVVSDPDGNRVALRSR